MKVKKVKFDEQVVKILAGGSASSRDIEELQTQITTNATDISNIKNGTTIDSFGDVESALSEKQDTLTFDDTPTENSANPVTSGGVYNSQEEQNTLIAELQEENTYLNSVINQLPKVSDSGESITLNNTIQAKIESTLKGNTSQETSPTPDAPVDVQVVTGDNTINISGKNLFDKDNVNKINGAIVSSGILQGGVNYETLYIPCKNNTTYTIQKSISNFFRIAEFLDVPEINSTYISWQNNNLVTSLTFTTTTGNYLALSYYNANSDTLTEQQILDSIQIEKGNQATTYEPYQGQSYEINLGDIELCKIGDYQDRIYKDSGKWYLEKQIGKVVLDGSEDWNNFNIEPSGLGRAMVSSSNVYYNSTQNTIMANNMVGVEYTGSWNKDYDCIATLSNNRFISYLKNASDLSTFKSILSNSNSIVYYVLATPTTTEIADTTLISQLEALKTATSYDNQTNISQINNDAPFIISASALYDLNNLVTRIQILESEV